MARMRQAELKMGKWNHRGGKSEIRQDGKWQASQKCLVHQPGWLEVEGYWRKIHGTRQEILLKRGMQLQSLVEWLWKGAGERQMEQRGFRDEVKQTKLE